MNYFTDAQKNQLHYTKEEILIKQTIAAYFNRWCNKGAEKPQLVKTIVYQGYRTALVKEVISKMINAGEIIGAVDPLTAITILTLAKEV